MDTTRPIDLVDRLRTEPKCTCSATFHGECVCETMWPADFCEEAADEIERLRSNPSIDRIQELETQVRELTEKLSVAESQIAELLPFAFSDAQVGVDIGPGIIEGECCPDCDDCRWHKTSVTLLSRIESGEFGLIPPFG